MAKKYVLGPHAAAELSKLIHGNGVVSRRANLTPSVAVDSEYVLPFTVQWAASADEGAGSWIIWLPASNIVSVDGATVDPTSNLDDAEGDYPDGWYLLSDSVLDRDEGGTLYLQITGGSSPTCQFSSSAGSSGSGSYSVAICSAAVDSDTGARTVKQFVSSSIVIASGSDDDNYYFCDEKSISRIGQQSSDPTQTFNTHYFHIKGFGKFTADGYTQAVGSYLAPATAELEVGGDESSFACVVRTGNSTSADANELAYKKIKIKGLDFGSSPFQYTKSGSGDAITHKLVNCMFYWNGELKTLADFDVSGVIGSGSVYLRGKQQAPSSSTPDPDWTWNLGTSAETAPEGGKVLNYKLYDFSQSKVSVDYRTTFLELADHTTPAYFEVKKPDGDVVITIDATGDDPSLTITNGDGKTISLDTADIPSDCDGELAIHELTYVDEDGDEQIYHGLFCADIDLPEVSQKTIVAGSGISISTSGNTITITNTRSSGGEGSSSTTGFTGEKTVVSDVSYDSANKTLNMQLERWTFENGLLKSVAVDSSLTNITTAVEETV